MEQVFILILVVAIAIFVSYPLFMSKFEKESPVADSPESPLESKLRKLDSEKESLLRAIKEIDFDHELGKLSKNDYQELYTKYKTQAALVLKEIDAVKMGGGTSIDEELEREIEEARKLRAGYNQNMEKEILNARKSKVGQGPFCTRCGAQCQTEDKFCSSCGASLG